MSLKETTDHRGRLEDWARHYNLPFDANDSDADLRARIMDAIKRLARPGETVVEAPTPRRSPKLSFLVLLIWILLIAAMVGSIAATAEPVQPGPCAWCPPAPCITDTSCGGCSCLKVGDASLGTCVSNR